MAFHAAQYDGRLGYTAQDSRQLVETSLAGVGIIDVGDLLVSAGSGMNSSIAAGRATIRNTFLLTQGGLYLVRNDAATTYAHAAADPTNPRVDQVLVKVYDSTDGGDASDITTGVVVQGTANAGGSASTMLDSRAGAASLAGFNNYILAADVYIPAGASSSASFTYRDRRPLATPVVPPSVKSSISAVTFYNNALVNQVFIMTTSGATVSSFNNLQYASAQFLPRRITATKIRWVYTQGNVTAGTGNYNIGIYDASGRLITSTGSVAFTGSEVSVQQRAETIPATTLEAGMYFVVMGWADGNDGTLDFVCPFTPQIPNTGLNIVASNGIVMPTTLLGFTDNVGHTLAGALIVPQIALSTV